MTEKMKEPERKPNIVYFLVDDMGYGDASCLNPAGKIRTPNIDRLASDNGCAHYIGAKEMEAQGHFPGGGYRGYKSDAWDGGHRIPCIARWPGMIKPGTESGALICLSDLMATCADMLGQEETYEQHDGRR